MTRLPISIELRFQRIKTRWVRRDDHGLLVPQTDQGFIHRLVTHDDPWELRNEFLAMKHTEEATLGFLNRVGVWSATEEKYMRSPREQESRLDGAFGHRFLSGRALQLTLREFWATQQDWRKLLDDMRGSQNNPVRLRRVLTARFGSLLPNGSGGDLVTFAMQSRYSNTLPLHLEWRDNQLHAIIQPITGHELMVATVWADVVTHAKFQVCENCGIPFTGRKRKFHDWNCGHLVSVRAWRKRKNKQKVQGGEARRRSPKSPQSIL
jgi:hypothetical protein